MIIEISNTLNMKTRKIYTLGLAAVLMAAMLSGCKSYEETPPLTMDYLTTYIMPDGTFLTDGEWEEVEYEEAEYEEFLKSE